MVIWYYYIIKLPIGIFIIFTPFWYNRSLYDKQVRIKKSGL